MEGSPAALAGLRERDIVLAVDGQSFPRLKPDHIVTAYFGQEILRRQPGDILRLTIARDGVRQEYQLTLGDEPKLPREAERQFFARLGFTVREFLVNDSIAQRVRPDERAGVIVRFVKPGSAVATAGLLAEDWIREIDGVEIKTYAQALERLEKIERDNARSEFILLVSRGGETAVLRVKLN
jgi:serine protease Do